MAAPAPPRTALAPLRPARPARRAARPDRWPGAGLGRGLGRPEIDDARDRLRRRRCWRRRKARWAMPAACRRLLPPHRRRAGRRRARPERASSRDGLARPPWPRPSSHRAGRRPPRRSGQRDAAAPGEQQEQTFVLGVGVRVTIGPLVTGVAQQRRPVTAIQQVGVVAVAGVDLDEGAGAVGRPARGQLGPAADDTLERELRHVESGPAESVGHSGRARSPVREHRGRRAPRRRRDSPSPRRGAARQPGGARDRPASRRGTRAPGRRLGAMRPTSTAWRPPSQPRPRRRRTARGTASRSATSRRPTPRGPTQPDRPPDR